MTRISEKKFQREIITSGKRRAVPIKTTITADIKIIANSFDADDVVDQMRDLFGIHGKIRAGNSRTDENYYTLSASNVPDLDRALNWLEERDLLG